MNIYISVYILALFNSLLSLGKRLFSVQLGILLSIIVFTIIAFRYASVDYFQYEYIYDNINDFDSFNYLIYEFSAQTPIESGYALLILFEKSLYGNFFFFIFFFSLISVSLKFYTFNKLSPFYIISILIYLSDEYFWKDLGQIRNSLASALVLLSVVYVYKKSYLKYFSIIFIATLFHSSALIGLSIYLFKYLKNQIFLVLILIFSVVIAITGGFGLILTEFIGVQLGLDDTSRLIKYTESLFVGEGGFFSGTNMMHLLISILMIYFYKPLVSKWSYNIILIPMYIFGTSLMFIFVDYGIIWGRIREMLCVPALVVSLPSFILLFRGYQKFIPYFAIVSYCILWFYLMMKDREEYQSILQFIY